MAKARHNRLFQSKTVARQQEKFLGEPKNFLALHQIVLKWIVSLRSEAVDEVKEVSSHVEFLNDLFRGFVSGCIGLSITNSKQGANMGNSCRKSDRG